jgi:hypothetical protein
MEIPHQVRDDALLHNFIIPFFWVNAYAPDPSLWRPGGTSCGGVLRNKFKNLKQLGLSKLDLLISNGLSRWISNLLLLKFSAYY